MATETNFQKILLQELQELLQPLADAASSEELRNELLGSLGWDVDGIEGFPLATLNDALISFSAAFEGLDTLINDAPEGIEGLAEAFKTTVFITEGILQLSDAFANSGGATPEGFARLGKELLDFLAINHLLIAHPFAYHVLYLLTVIDDFTPAPVVENGTVVRMPRPRRILRLDQIPKLLSDPVGTLEREYFLESGLTSPEQAAATADKLFPRLLFFARATGADASYGVNPADLPDFDFGEGGNALVQHMLTVFWPLPDADDTGTLGVGTGLALSSDLGVVLRPVGAIDHTELFGAWQTTVRVVLQAEGVAVSSDGVSIPPGATGGIQFELDAERIPQPTQSGIPLAFRAGSTTGTRLEVSRVRIGSLVSLSPGSREYGFSFAVAGARFVIAKGDGDGFLQSVLPSEIPIEFDFSIGWSNLRGLYFGGAAGLEMVLPVHVSIAGVLDIDTIALGIRTDGQAVDISATATFTAHIGAVIDIVAQDTGLLTKLTFPDGDREVGNLGPVHADLGFQLPRGLGIAVHAGPVTGGGFIFLDPGIGRYSGALELSVFGIGVKAFGIVDTRFPDGTEGFSFVIVIIAEFTPIQLGFGFTLVGVGGLLAINRTVDAEALGEAARTGSLAHLLFPRNPVADAPAILNDLGTVFPPSRGRTIVGPMAKLGWGTPTLITADLGVLIEFPGPRIAVLGVVRMKLPSPELAILSLQLAVAGLIDFPAQLFSLDAGLFDSYVAGYGVSGDMAFRLGFGDNTQFLLSVGGFNSGYAPPPRFPDLRRASVDLGVNGNPSLTASGYFALTSNTAQIGASIELRASGYGIRLHGWLGFDVLFVFSPFSFTASISAGVRVSFHGAGLGITLRGTLSGPTPWRVSGKVCVSVLFWDACLPISLTFGRQEPAALPELDPWDEPVVDPNADPRVRVLRVKQAVEDPRNWAGSNRDSAIAGITLAPSATLERTPIDPVGAATLRQRVAPLNQLLEKFGEYKPIINDHFTLTSVLVNGDELVSEVDWVFDKFAPAHFEDLSNADKLKAGSYDDMVAGFTIAPDRVEAGTAGSRVLEYETALIDENGDLIEEDDLAEAHRLTEPQLFAMLERSASALSGIRHAGLRRYAPPPGKPVLVTLAAVRFVVGDACDHTRAVGITPTETTATQARLALKAHVRNNPADRHRFTVLAARAA